MGPWGNELSTRELKHAFLELTVSPLPGERGEFEWLLCVIRGLND